MVLNNRELVLTATQDDVTQWLESYHASKYPDDDSAIWGTRGTISYYSPTHDAIEFAVKTPKPNKLRLSVAKHASSPAAVAYVNDLLDAIAARFGDMTLPGGFSIVVKDRAIADLLEDRWRESVRAQQIEAYLATTVLLGSILEGILLDTIKTNPKKANKAKAAPRFTQDGQARIKPFGNWGLEALIDVCLECGWLSDNLAYNTKGVRKYRNLIHPNEQLALNIRPDEVMCDIARAIVNAALKDLQRYTKNEQQSGS